MKMRLGKARSPMVKGVKNVFMICWNRCDGLCRKMGLEAESVEVEHQHLRWLDAC